MTAQPQPGEPGGPSGKDAPGAKRALGTDPRVERHRALIRGFVGAKVSLSTTDFHHLVGRLLSLDADDRLRLTVNERELWVKRGGVARIHGADPALAEYLK